MPTYAYKARQADGQMIQGTLRAVNEERATTLLRSHNLTPIAIAVSDEASIWNKTIFGGGANMKDLILFSRQMSSMIRSGVPILAALKALTNQTEKPHFQKVLREMAYDIESGESLSGAMSKQTSTFSPFFLGVVRTGEASGRLSESLASLGSYLERDYAFLRKVRGAMLYPVFVLAVVIILTIIMFTFVLPQLVALFADAGVELPWPTRVLIAVTNFFQSYWLGVVLVLVLGGVLLRSYIKTPEGRYALSSYLLRIPGVSILFQKFYMSRMTSILHTLFSSNVPVLESLGLAREAVGNRVYQRILQDTIDSIKDGSSISVVWKQEAYIPPMLTAMVSVGEKSGEIDKVFNEASQFFQEDVESILETITILLEPVLILILGAGVGIIVGAILLPIYNLVLVL